MGKLNDDFKCDMCEYSCKKRNMLIRNINTKHNDHKCTICFKVFPNSTYALMHSAQKHTQNMIEEFPKMSSDKVND